MYPIDVLSPAFLLIGFGRVAQALMLPFQKDVPDIIHVMKCIKVYVDDGRVTHCVGKATVDVQVQSNDGAQCKVL